MEKLLEDQVREQQRQAMKPETTDRYTLANITPVGQRRKTDRVRALFDHFLPSLPDSAKVLEIGPGRGEFARGCLSRGLSYVGIEPSEELCESLEQTGIPVMNQTVPPIKVESNSFDLIHSNDFVEHLASYVDVMHFFGEAFRVLKPGGYLSVVAPNYATIKELFFRYEYQHSYITTRDRLLNLGQDCGFQIVHTKCFLWWLSRRMNRIDRLFAHTIIPLATNPLIESLVTLVMSEDFLFRVHKNVCDHVGILARKPYQNNVEKIAGCGSSSVPFERSAECESTTK
jgi:SAM-dependent methyltransferase